MSNKLQIPWDFIDEKWVCAAQDEDGSIYFYHTIDPIIGGTAWFLKSGEYACIGRVLKIKPVTDWKQSKTMRGE